MSKICKMCEKELTINKFSKKKSNKDGLDKRCKDCFKNYKKKLYETKKSKQYKIFDFDMNSYEWQVGKHMGSITFSNNSYKVSIQNKNTRINRTFNKDKFVNAKEEAEKFVKQTSIENGLTKNMIRKIDDNHIEVKIDDNHIMKTDIKFLDLCQQYCICKGKSGSNKNAKYYPKITIDGKTHNFHKYITRFEMTDHINRDPFDNRLINLRETTYKQNNNNRNASKKYDGNHIMGVRFVNKDNSWQARIKQDGKEYSKMFSVKKYGNEEAKNMAIEARDEFKLKFNSKNG